MVGADTDEYFRLWALIHRTRKAILKARSRELAKVGISVSEAGVLFVVRAIGTKATPAEISRWLMREPNSVSTLTDRMQKKGLVKKVKDLDRKNLVRIEITEKGQQAYDLSTKRGSINRMLSVLSEAECRHLSLYLDKLWIAGMAELGIDKPPWPYSL